MDTPTVTQRGIMVDRRPGLSHSEFIKTYANNGIPVVIPGAMKAWDAFKNWDPEYFRNILGNKKVTVAGKEYLLRDFMNTVMESSESNPSGYLNEVNIHKDFPELLPDIVPHLSYALPDRLMSKWLPESWGMRKGIIELLIGGKGTKFPTLHYDGYHLNTFVTQIRGDKEFFLYSPDQTPYMYPEEKMVNRSLVNDIHEPDLTRFPLFAKAKPIRVTAYQGDTVFLPAGWWHSTRLLSLSIAVSTNSVGPLQWNDFVDDFISIHVPNKIKQTFIRTQLAVAGRLMSLSGK